MDESLDENGPGPTLRQRINRRLARLEAAVIAGLVLIGLLLLITYLRRPMFARNFELRDRGLPWPRWTTRAWGDQRRQLVLIDESLNTVAYIVASDDAARRAAFLWDPKTVGDHALLHYLLVDNGKNVTKQVSIPKMRNRLFLFAPDGTSKDCELKAGEAMSIERSVPEILRRGLRQDFGRRLAGGKTA
jgi:hypothetical protein